MKMNQLNYFGKQDLRWVETINPEITESHMVIVKPMTVATCDMDGIAIQGMVPFKGPTPLGHEGEGIIEDVGSEVSRWKVGDRVIIPWKVACGSCTSCGRGHTAQCDSVATEDAYGWGPTAPKWGGFLSDAVVVPYADFMLTKLPEGTNPIMACGVADNISDGYRTVAPHLKERPGGTVLVVSGVGPGSIGLYGAGIAVSLGASKVVYVDPNEKRLSIAKELGAEAIKLEPGLLEGFATDKRSLNGGFDITVDASGIADLLPMIINATGRAGACVSSAGVMYMGKKIGVDFYSMYRKSISFHTGWVHTQSIIDEPLELIKNNQFDPSPVITEVASWNNAIDALVKPFTKVIVSREKTND